MVDPLGARTTITYNGAGQPLTETDPLGHVTRFEYDAVGNLTATVDSLDRRTTREYDVVSRVTRRVNPLGQAKRFGYDHLNRLETVLDALAGVTRFTYDPNGNLLTVTDARGNTTTQTYDSMNRLATRTDPMGTAESFGYDPMSNLARHIDRKGQVATFSYDALNRWVGGVYADATTSLVYDDGGRVVRVSDSVGGMLVNQYDALDRLVTQTTSLWSIGYQYDVVGRRTAMTAPGQAPITYVYDAASRLMSIAQAGQLVQFEHDLAGRRTQTTLPNQISTEYQYDAASQVTALIYRRVTDVLGDLTYQYDPAGRRVAVGGSYARTRLPDAVASATYDTANRQRIWGGLALTYDANGNLTGDGAATYGWDARNRLSAVTAAGVTTVFRYDALGRRHEKTTAGAATRYHHDGENPVQILAGAGVTTLLGGLNLDEFFAVTTPAGARTLLTDVLGSTVAELDPSAAELAAYQYAPYGQTFVTGNPGTPWQYSGRENDGGDLYYYRMRYYHAGRSRFLSEDPTRLAAREANLYAYVGGDPITYSDPLGLWRLAPGVPYPKDPRVAQLLTDVEDCLGEDLYVTSTHEIKGRIPGTAHPRGDAFDIRYPRDPERALCCAALHGAANARDELKHPIRRGVAPHIHVSIVPGLRDNPGGPRGDLPANTCPCE